MNTYVLRIDPMMDIFMQFLLAENTSLAETHVLGVSPVRMQNGCCRNQKKLDYEIETDIPSLAISYQLPVEIKRNSITRLKHYDIPGVYTCQVFSGRNQKKLDYEIETSCSHKQRLTEV